MVKWRVLSSIIVKDINRPSRIVFVYITGLHVVLFGNNLMKKIPSTAKTGPGRRPSPIWLSDEFSITFQLLPNWTSM